MSVGVLVGVLPEEPSDVGVEERGSFPPPQPNRWAGRPGGGGRAERRPDEKPAVEAATWTSSAETESDWRRDVVLDM